MKDDSSQLAKAESAKAESAQVQLSKLDTSEFLRIRNRTLAVALLILIAIYLGTFASDSIQKKQFEFDRSNFVVDLNHATHAELNLLPGVGPKLASEILNLRASQGKFSSIDELTKIRGIKDTRLASLKKYVVVSADR